MRNLSSRDPLPLSVAEQQAETKPVSEPPATEKSASVIRMTFWQKVEAYFSRLSVQSRFWNQLLAFFCMPAVFRSGIRMQKTKDAFEAVLPFRRFNRNAYGNMSGAALLGNCEVAAGGYIYYASLGQFQVVCKDLQYRFRCSCTGPVKYVVAANDQLKHLISELKPFTIAVKTEIYQLDRNGEIAHRIGKALATFHARPIGYQRTRDQRS